MQRGWPNDWGVVSAPKLGFESLSFEALKEEKTEAGFKNKIRAPEEKFAQISSKEEQNDVEK